MGAWNVMSVVGNATPLDNPFGHNFNVTIKIKYTTSKFGRFVEPPILAWDEIILFNNYAKPGRWEFKGNMYEHKPASPTVAVWGQRYFRAYLQAHNKPYQALGGKQKGQSKLYDKNFRPVSGADLGVHNDIRSQNDAVRDYLKRHGGILEIMVHDIPGISLASGRDRDIERILIFNCGVKGMGARVKAWQHLAINTSRPRSTWTRNFQLNASPPGIKTTGLPIITDAAQFSNTAPPEGSAD